LVRARHVSRQAVLMAYGHNVSKQVLRSFGCALAIPAHPEDLLRNSNVEADPVMGFVQRDQGRQAYRQGWAAGED
jgi:hypothetical protein